MKNAKPMMKMLRAEFMSTNCRFDRPTPAIIPNITQYMPPTIGWGMVVNSAPNFPNTASTIMITAPQRDLPGELDDLTLREEAL